MKKQRIVTTDTNQLYQAILALKTADQAQRFFADLLTVDELAEFSKRWQTAQLLAGGLSYEEITNQTNLSSTTIARVSRCLTGPMGGYRLALNQSHHHALKSQH